MNRMDTAEKLVETALKLGAEDAEAFVADTAEVDIRIKDGQVESVSHTDTSGYGLRILRQGKMGFASSNHYHPGDAEKIIARLIKYTDQHTADEHNVFPDPVEKQGPDEIPGAFDEGLATIPIEEKIRKAVAIEDVARAVDSRIVQVPWLQYGDFSMRYAIVSSRGIKGESRKSESFGAAMALAMGDNGNDRNAAGNTQTGTGIDVKAAFSELDPESVGRKAAEFALRMLGAKDGKTDEIEGVFPPDTGYNFINLVVEMCAADLVQKKKSLYTGKLRQKVASDTVNIVDDGLLPGGLGSIAVDSEGVPATRKEIIKNGVLSSFLYDSYTAHRGETQSTGNAMRRTFTSRPYIAPTNFFMEPGGISRDSLLSKVKRGLYVTEVSGLHASVDRVTGNFSIPAKGLIIENGDLTAPVSNITISGNIFDFFKSIDAVADDLTWEPREDVIGTPTFKVAGIKISGQ